MERRNWPALIAAIGAVFSVLMAIWPGGMLEGGHQRIVDGPVWWFIAHLVAGSLGVAAILLAHSSLTVARALLGVGALLLLTLLVTEPFGFLAIITNVLPALMMALGAATLALPTDDLPRTARAH